MYFSKRAFAAAGAAITMLPGIALAQGVDYGADKATYIAALEDIDPIELTMQTGGTPGSVAARHWEYYADFLEEWSGGKIEVEMAYGNSIMPGDAGPAIADGRLAAGLVIPGYSPDDYQALALLNDFPVSGAQTPLTALLKNQAVLLELSTGDSEVVEELTDAGVQPGLTALPGPPTGLVCNGDYSTLDKLRGKQARVSSPNNARQVENLDMSPVSMGFNEVYEALQRGIVDCAVFSAYAASYFGLEPVAPYFLYNSEVGIGGSVMTLGFDQYLWEDLPLPVKQLMYDGQKAFLRGWFDAQLELTAQGVKNMTEAGGGPILMDDESAAAIRAANESLIESIRTSPALPDAEAKVAEAQELSEKWDRLLEELGYTEKDTGYDGVVDLEASGDLDVEPYLDRLFEEVLLAGRPE